MLDLFYLGDEKKQDNELTLEARRENLNHVLAFLEGHLARHGCPPKVQRQIEIAAEEIFVNIASYAYGTDTGSATVRFSMDGNTATVTFMDNGIQYNPLEKPDPDVTLPAAERSIGGLGIYMVKKSMDDMSYEYKDGQNILTIRKAF